MIAIFHTGHSDDGDTEEDTDHWGEKMGSDFFSQNLRVKLREKKSEISEYKVRNMREKVIILSKKKIKN